MIILRYADDTVVGFEHETDARRFLDMMRLRLEEFALSLHPEKTRLIEFGRHAAAEREQRGLGKPETFNFLGFTFICSKTRKGRFQVIRKTRRDRMMAKPPGTEGGNAATHALANLRTGRMAEAGCGEGSSTTTPCRPTAELSRPSDTTSRSCGNARYGGGARGVERRGTGSPSWLRSGSPKPRILHPWPSVRFAVKHPR